MLPVFASLYVWKSMECCHNHHRHHRHQSWMLPLMHTFHPIWLTDMGVNQPNHTIHVPVINFICTDVIFSIPYNWQLWNIPLTVCLYQKLSVNCALLWGFVSLPVGYKQSTLLEDLNVWFSALICVALYQIADMWNTNWSFLNWSAYIAVYDTCDRRHKLVLYISM